MKKILAIVVIIIFNIFFLLFIYWTFQAVRIWLIGERVEARIISMEKKAVDEYELTYALNKSDSHSIIINRRAYNILESKGHLRVLYWDKDVRNKIYPQINGNQLFNLLLGILICGVLGIGSAKRIYKKGYQAFYDGWNGK